jgi:multicomponent Na+:H+ antiporter subunit E
MSEQVEPSSTTPPTNTAWRMRKQWPLLVALVVLWTLLWGSVSWLNLATGVVLALAVTRALYLPPVELSGRFNLFWFVVFLMRFLGSLVVASFQVAFLAFTPRTGRNNSVIAVDLRTRSDFIMTLTAVALSLMPGSFVLDVEREQSILYLHVLGFPSASGGRSRGGTSGDQEADEVVRGRVLGLERQIVRALGSKADMKMVRK